MKTKFLVRMTTERGVFWWDGASIYDRRAMQETGDAFRAWGWLEDAARAQRFQTHGNAVRAAQRLSVELGRLYAVKIDVVGVEIGVLGLRPLEEIVVEVGDYQEIGD